MSSPWSVNQVVSVAPDSRSEVAGRKLATPSSWTDTGTDGVLVWGACQGSGKKPYQVSVDTAGPRYRCSCPSRKFPCKHALGLLFLWAEGRLGADAEPSGELSSWGYRESKPAAGEKELTAEEAAAQVERAAERLARREARVDDGMAELLLWLNDRLEAGLASLSGRGYGEFPDVARRMVDAQAPGVARRLEACGSVLAAGREDWVERVSVDMAAVHALARAWLRRGDLDADLAETVRGHIGFTHRADDILTRSAVRDLWVVVGLFDTDEDTLTSRRVWLHGHRTRSWALVQSYGRSPADLEVDLRAGRQIEADLHFYPGQPQWRAVVGARHGEMVPTRELIGDVEPATVERATGDWVAALAADPWAELAPVRVTGVLVPPTTGPWTLVDAAGDAVRIRGVDEDLWSGLLATGGRPVTWWGEWSDAGFQPLSWTGEDHRQVVL